MIVGREWQHHGPRRHQDMKTITGNHLFSSSGDDIGEVKDVIGGGGPEGPSWLSVKTGLFATRLVPFELVEERGDSLVTDLTTDQVKSAPKTDSHLEPVGEDREALLSHYRLADAP
jgi:hypothetical protein